MKIASFQYTQFGKSVKHQYSLSGLLFIRKRKLPGTTTTIPGILAHVATLRDQNMLCLCVQQYSTSTKINHSEWLIQVSSHPFIERFDCYQQDNNQIQGENTERERQLIYLKPHLFPTLLPI